jgi:hypothetical protein
MTNLVDPIDGPRRAQPKDRTAGLLAFAIVMLLLVHLSGDIIYGFETGVTIHAVAAIMAGAWLALVLILGPRSAYALVLLVSCLAPIVPLIHMSGTGVADDVQGTEIGLVLFIWTLLALGAIGPVSILLALRGLWRLRKGMLSFFMCSAPPIGAGAALLAYVLMT